MAKRKQVNDSAERSPDADEVRAELARVLASSVFEPASRATDFLRFVVEETLSGRGPRLKGYTVAVEVFGRPADFDSQTDPLVRVEAGRLRLRLMEYYQGEGHDDPVRIALPRGGYMPTFRYASGPSGQRAEGRLFSARAQRRFLAGAAAGAAAFVVITGLLAWWLYERGSPTAAPPTARAGVETEPSGTRIPRMIVLPLTNLSGDPAFEPFTAGLSEEIILALVQLDIVATASPTGLVVESAALAELREQFDAGYVLTGSVRTAPGSIRISVRVIDADAGTQLWTQTFDEDFDASSAVALQERVAGTIGVLLASPYGPIFAREIALLGHEPATEADPYECLLRFYGYTRTFDAREHTEAVRCMQRTVSSEPQSATAWSALAVLYLHEHNFGFTPQPDRGDALERALEAVRRALDIDGTDRVAAITMPGIQLAGGDREGFERSVERALAISPPHPAVRAQIGYLLTLAGDWQRGRPLVEEAIPVTANVPGWYNVTYAFAYLQAGDYEAAHEWALRIDAPNWFVTPLTVAATAALVGRKELAKREVARLLELYPDFASTGRRQLATWQLNESLRAILLDGLELAGLSTP